VHSQHKTEQNEPAKQHQKGKSPKEVRGLPMTQSWNLEMQGQSLNVVENKGPLWTSCRGIWHVVDNKVDIG